MRYHWEKGCDDQSGLGWGTQLIDNQEDTVNSRHDKWKCVCEDYGNPWCSDEWGC